MASADCRSSISLDNLSLQPCIDKLTKAILSDDKQVSQFSSAQTLREQVFILLKAFTHKPQVTVR